MRAYSRNSLLLTFLLGAWLIAVIFYGLSQLPMPSNNDGAVVRNNNQEPLNADPQVDLAQTLEKLKLDKGLQGSQIDAHLQLDSEQELLFDIGLWRLFEYLQAHKPDRHLIVIGLVESQFGPAQTALVTRYLNAYSHYHRDLSHLLEQEQPISAELFDAVLDTDEAAESRALKQGLFLLEQQLALAVQYFGMYPVYPWLEQQLNTSAVKMQQLMVQADDELAHIDKLRQIEALQETLPDQEQQTYKQWQERQQIQQALSQAGDDVQVKYQIREQAYGAAAAKRLSELDKQQHAWQEQVHHYQVQLSKLDLQTAAGQEQQALLLETFSPAQQRRLKALMIKKLTAVESEPD